ncbi:MAG TPA: Gfo/Idh/MocA family oxidoreductase [Syntrophobacteraceae bacterium]|nr:Gfo/Idh/MocA family oxidoreductase [Syntrophobacteraceae bacterium]
MVKPCIAVVGSGYWGTNLVRNYHQLGALRVVCDKNDLVLDQFRNQYPDVETCMALNEILSNDQIAGVAVATPAETHFDIAREVLLSGKHVYVEKPLVLDEREGEELIDIAENSGLRLMVGHLLQYHPAFVRLKDLVAQGELGRINYIYSHRLNLGKIRREENILWSFAPHDISMILALAGEYPESVLATGGNYLHSRIADVTTTHLEFPSGLGAHIFVSWLHPHKVQQLVVVGDRQMAVFDDTRPWSEKLLLYPHKIKWQNNVPVPSKAEPQCVEVPQAEPLRVECEHFLYCMSNQCNPVTDGREGLRVLRVLKASQRSLDRQGARVSLSDSIAPAPSGVILSPLPAHFAPVAPGSGARDPASPPSFFAHETAVIDAGVRIGAGTKIWHFSHILSNSHIGEGCNIGQNVVIGPHVVIGNRCKIQNNVSVYEGVTLEDGVFCGPSMVFTNIFNPRAEISKMDQVRPTLVRRGATLGANCTVLCGVTVGRYALIGAGAVVTKDVPDHALVAGNPAFQRGWVCACGEKLDAQLRCAACGAEYRTGQNRLRRIADD